MRWRIFSTAVVDARLRAAVNHHARALLRQHGGDRESDAGGGARHYG